MDFLNDTEYIIFLDTYLYKYVDKKSVGLYNNNEIIYDKKTRSISATIKDGVLTFNSSAKRTVLKNCFKNRKKFGWFNEYKFQELVYKDKQQRYSENYKL